MPSHYNMVQQIRSLASKVLFALSVNNFGAVFSRISGRLQELSVSNDQENPDNHTDIELIQHIDVNIGRLVKLLAETVAKFKNLKNVAKLPLMASLEKAVWNWMDNYPHEFTELQHTQNEELSRCCENLFELLDNFSETKNRYRPSTWPLQMLLLVLTPKVLEEIYNADTGAPCSARHLPKRKFIDRSGHSLNTFFCYVKTNVELLELVGKIRGKTGF